MNGHRKHEQGVLLKEEISSFNFLLLCHSWTGVLIICCFFMKALRLWEVSVDEFEYCGSSGLYLTIAAEVTFLFDLLCPKQIFYGLFLNKSRYIKHKCFFLEINKKKLAHCLKGYKSVSYTYSNHSLLPLMHTRDYFQGADSNPTEHNKKCPLHYNTIYFWKHCILTLD